MGDDLAFGGGQKTLKNLLQECLGLESVFVFEIEVWRNFYNGWEGFFSCRLVSYQGNDK